MLTESRYVVPFNVVDRVICFLPLLTLPTVGCHKTSFEAISLAAEHSDQQGEGTATAILLVAFGKLPYSCSFVVCCSHWTHLATIIPA